MTSPSYSLAGMFTPGMLTDWNVFLLECFPTGMSSKGIFSDCKLFQLETLQLETFQVS